MCVFLWRCGFPEQLTCYEVMLKRQCGSSEGSFVYLQCSLQSALFIQSGGGLVETCGWLVWGSECSVSSGIFEI